MAFYVQITWEESHVETVAVQKTDKTACYCFNKKTPYTTIAPEINERSRISFIFYEAEIQYNSNKHALEVCK